MEHLQELRRRIIIALVAVALGTIIGFIWYQSAPFGLRPLGEILRGPYCELPAELRASFSPDGQCRLLATGPFEMFLLRLKVGLLAGLVLSSPVWLAQIWGFITPGLLHNERRVTGIFVTLAVILFSAGAALAYFVLAVGLEFLLGVGDEVQTTALSGRAYYDFLLALLIIFGVSFEVPLILGALNIVGILRYEDVKDKRRIIIVIIMIFAAFMTPGQEPFSMLILSAAIVALVELALQFAKWNDKRRAQTQPDWLNTSDESASTIAPAAPVPAPAPMPRAPQSQHPPASPAAGFEDVL